MSSTTSRRWRGRGVAGDGDGRSRGRGDDGEGLEGNCEGEGAACVERGGERERATHESDVAVADRQGRGRCRARWAGVNGLLERLEEAGLGRREHIPGPVSVTAKENGWRRWLKP